MARWIAALLMVGLLGASGPGWGPSMAQAPPPSATPSPAGLAGAVKIVPRLTVLTASQVASVVLHQNIANAIPPVGYLTFADRFMIVNCLGLVGGIALTALAVFFADRKRPERAALTSRLLFWIPPARGVLQYLNAASLLLRG